MKISDDYYWRDDIVEIKDRSDLSDDERYDVYDRLDEDDPISVWSFSKNSMLYSLLREWYAKKGADMEDSIRSYLDYGGHIYFVTGCGYAIMSADLLGGSADGLAEREFDDFVRSFM